MSVIGDQFAQAIAKQDSEALLALLDSSIDFRGLTPGQFWEADSATELVDKIILGSWFGGPNVIEALEDVQHGAVVGRDRVAYRLRIRNPNGLFLCEQQAYCGVENDRINLLMIMCSGFQAIDDEPTPS